jgi:hypothetical protein
MSAITATDSRRTGIEAALPFLAFVLPYAVMLIGGGALLNDGDTYWHLVVGGWIVSHGFPHTDPFSFTFAGKPWIAKEWLSQLLYFAAWKVAGWTGVVALAAGAIALALALLARALHRTLVPLGIMVALAAAFVLVAPHALARPHALSLPLAVIWTAGLSRAADRREAPTWWLLVVMVAWANIHAGFTFGIILAIAFGLDAVASAAPAERRRTAFVWAGFALLSLVAGCITPYGPESMLATVKVLGLGPALSLIGEWKPADFAHLGALEIVLLAGMGLALYRGVTLPPVRILIVLGLVHMTLSAERNAELLGLLTPLVVAAPLARQFRAYAALPTARPHAARALLTTAAATILAVATAAGAGSLMHYRPADAVTPAAALDAARQAGATRIMNAYDFGGYLVARGVPVFIDGRSELYGGAFIARHVRAVTLADLKDFLAQLNEFSIDATMLPPAAPAVALLDTLPGWKRTYADAIAVVHVRTSAN